MRQHHASSRRRIEPLKRFLCAAIACACLALAPAQAESPTGDAPLCRAIARHLEAQGSLLTAKPGLLPIDALSNGPHPLVELAARIDAATVSDARGIRARQDMNAQFHLTGRLPVDEKDYIASFAERFHPGGALAQVVAETAPYNFVEITKIPGGTMAALTAMSGSAGCTEFVFFNTGGRSGLLPDPPVAMDGSLSDNTGRHRFECYVSRGYLARIANDAVFIVADYGVTDYDSDFRVSAFAHGKWSKGCSVAMDFETRYAATAIWISDTGGLSRKDLVGAAPGIARALDAAEANKTSFAFGPPVPAKDEARVEQIAAAGRNGSLSFGDAPVPGFSNQILEKLRSAAALPIVLHGATYIIQATHPALGWRDEPGYILSIYRIEGERLMPVASATIDASRDSLRAVWTRALTRQQLRGRKK